MWARLKFEGGVHRVQRVPVTESQGRIHTSAAGVLVAPEAEDVDVTIDPNDLRIDVFRSSGPGGQSVNTTDSAVRITHLPTGIVVSCQNEKSQLQNKEQAMRILRARLLAAARATADAAASDARRSQVRTVDRSERVRTYNFPENRIADHRVGYKAYNLDAVLDGDLDAVLDALAQADRTERLATGTAGARVSRVVAARRRSWPRPPPWTRPACPAPAWTPRNWPRICSGSPGPGSGMTPLVESSWVDGYHALVAAARGADPAAAPGRLRAVRPGPAGGRARACSSRARRPSRWWTGRSRRSPAVRNPVVVDLCAGSGAIALAISAGPAGRAG